MMKLDLDKLLRKDDSDEIRNRKENREHYTMQPSSNVDGVMQVSDTEDTLFNRGTIHVSKHPRFAKMIAHKHSFVELNYMYSGSCVQYINDQKVVLKEGQLILMDKDTVHSIDTLDENDIIINILIKDSSLSTEYLNYLVQKQSIIFDFLIKASTTNADHNHFLVLETENNEQIQHLLQTIIYNFLEADSHSLQIIRLTIPILFVELSRQLEYQTIHQQVDKQRSEVINILKYIDTNYAHLTLSDVAKHFGYNTNYLSNKLKSETGSNFSEILNKKRLNMAILYMRENRLSLEEIAYYVGYDTPSSLFKLFKKYHHMSPRQYKRQMQL